MLQALGAASPYATAIAASPVAISTMLVLLLSPRRRALTRWFLGVWVAAIAAVVAAFLAVAPSAGPAAGAVDAAARRGPVGAPVDLGVGALLLALSAVALWRSARARGRPAVLASVDRLPPAAIAGIAAVFAANPIHLGLVAAGVRAVPSAGLAAGGLAVLVAGFTVIASAPLLLAAGLASAMPSSGERLLARADAWMAARGDALAAVVFLALGAWTLARALA